MNKKPEKGQGYIIYDRECMQETGTHDPNSIFLWNQHQMDLCMCSFLIVFPDLILFHQGYLSLVADFPSGLTDVGL